MNCKNCGNQIQPYMNYCPYCNTPLQDIKPKEKNNKVTFGIILLIGGGLLLIYVIIAMISANNTTSSINNTRRNKMRTTAQKIVDSVKLQLKTNDELKSGTYEFTNAITNYEEISAPFGGEYVYTKMNTDRIGAGVYRVSDEIKDINECNLNISSYVTIKQEGDNYILSICLSTTKGGWLMGTNNQLNDINDKSIFYGEAKK